MPKLYVYEYQLEEGDAYFVYAPSRVDADREIKNDLGDDVKYKFTRRRPF